MRIWMSALAFLFAMHAAIGAEGRVNMKIDSGAIQGVITGSVVSYKGIPYAAPPIAALRWRPPQPVAVWQGVRSAAAYGNDCLQNRFIADSAPSSQPMSEDCLYLNLWAPAAPHTKLLPVMVWIHGGGLTTGSGAPAVYSGEYLARQGVVVITFNYRLGRFGFFAHPALLKEHPEEPIGNYGLMDQVAALKWVQRNVKAFGGDPSNVTIFGQSSGGSSVLHMMINPEAKGLFARAIVQSGGGRDRWSRLDTDIPGKPSALKVGQAFAQRAGVIGDDPTALRAIPAAVVLGQLSLMVGEPETYSGPMVDGRLVPDDVDAGFAKGLEQRVPLIIGTTDDELGAVPSQFIPMMTAPVAAAFGPRQQGLEMLYADDSRAADLFDDVSFVEPARHLARLHRKNGAPVWCYRFSYVAEAARTPGAGAFHASEIPYVFATLDAVGKPVSEQDRLTSGAISSAWIQFATSGEPNGAGRPVWPACSATEDVVLDFGTDGPTQVSRPDQSRLNYIEASYPAP